MYKSDCAFSGRAKPRETVRFEIKHPSKLRRPILPPLQPAQLARNAQKRVPRPTPPLLGPGSYCWPHVTADGLAEGGKPVFLHGHSMTLDLCITVVRTFKPVNNVPCRHTFGVWKHFCWNSRDATAVGSLEMSPGVWFPAAGEGLRIPFFSKMLIFSKKWKKVQKRVHFGVTKAGLADFCLWHKYFSW